MTDSTDWEIDSNGFYVVTRSFLVRRGFCCANQCRNCPYINWHNSPTWQPLPAEAVKVAAVSLKALEGARKALAQHERQSQQLGPSEAAYHRAMIAHYRLLLERWEPAGASQASISPRNCLSSTNHLHDRRNKELQSLVCPCGKEMEPDPAILTETAGGLTKTRETEQNGKEAPLCLRFQQSIGEEFQIFQERRTQQGPMARYLFRNAQILDAERGDYLPDSSVLVEGDRILEVGGAEMQASDAQSLDLAGLTLLPGLIDAHVHVTAVTADLGRLAEWSPAYVTARAARVLVGMLRRGFTTVRDVDGADYGLAQAIEEGYLEGPRLLFGGKALSQTGGHGDVRGPGR